jgi:hypothetical protein
MATQIVTISSALPHWPVDATAAAREPGAIGTVPAPREGAIGPEYTSGGGASFHFSTRDVMNEFVELLKDNPKVWAVTANGDPGGIDVWTYIDSDEQRDREAVYEIEWELMKRYPEVAFDFSTILSPAGSEFLEHGHYTYLHRR